MVSLVKVGAGVLRPKPTIDIRTRPGGSPDDTAEIPTWVEPLPGLVPLGPLPIWVSPDEPVDPTDCSLYPDSIYCGGVPFSFWPDYGIPFFGVDVTTVLSDCAVGIRLEPVVAGIRFPPVDIVYARGATPYCPDPVPARIPLPDRPDTIIMPAPPPGCRYVVVYGYGQHAFTFDARCNIYGPVRGSSTIYNGPNMGLSGSYTNKYEYETNEGAQDMLYYVETYYTGFIPPVRDTSSPSSLLWWKVECITLVCDTEDDYPPVSYPFPTLAPPEPPPPPPPKKMDCCPQLIALLLQVKAMATVIDARVTLLDSRVTALDSKVDLVTEDVDKLSEIVGVEEYPLSLPASLISRDDGWLGGILPDASVAIPNLAKLHAWEIERFDEVVGQFSVDIQVKDSDPTTPGDQPVGLKIPNIAEGIAEGIGMLLQTSYNTEALLNIAVRNLIETGSDKIQNYKSYMLLQSLIDYVGYKYDEVETTIPMTFTPGLERLDEMLTDCQQKIQVAEFNEKLGLPDDLRKFLECWSMVKATHFRKIDTLGTAAQTAANVMGVIRGMQSTLDKVNEDPDGTLPHEQSERFYEDVESGFTTEPGATNTTDPYGVPFGERPKIRQIGID